MDSSRPSEATPGIKTPRWQQVWEQGIAPLLSEQQLEVLEKALREDDSRLIQGATTQPPPLWCVRDWPAEGACAISYCGWQGDDLETVAEIEEYFARMCYEIDLKMGEPATVRFFLNWFDSTPRREMIEQLLPVVSKTLVHRREEMAYGSL